MAIHSFMGVSRTLLLVLWLAVCTATLDEAALSQWMGKVSNTHSENSISHLNSRPPHLPDPGFVDLPRILDSSYTWLANCVQRGREGCTLLWSNFQTSRAIEKRRKAGEAISYKEYMMLDMDKTDRGKVFTMMMSAMFFPEYFPVMLIFNPAMLPSTFLGPQDEQLHKSYVELGVQRCAAIAEALCEVNKASYDKNKKKREQFLKVKKDLLAVLACKHTEDAFDHLEKYCFAATGKSQDNPDVSKLSQPLYRALVKGLGVAKQYYPRFMTNFDVNDYMKKLKQGDEVLLEIPAEDLSRKELLHACNRRCIGSVSSSDQELRDNLSEYLDIVYAEGSDDLNTHHTRIALIGIHMVQGARQSEEAILPRLAFTGKN